MNRTDIAAAARDCLPHDVAELYVSKVLDAVTLNRQVTKTSGSHFGGTPVVADPDWPTWSRGPLDFLACIDLADLADMHTGLDLPPTGSLSFFYASDFDHQPWGMHLEDQNGWRVIYTESGAGAETFAPEGSVVFDRHDLMPEQTASVPHLYSSSVRAQWEQQRNELITFWEELYDPRYEHLSNHQVGGWPMLHQRSFWSDGHYGLLGVPFNERSHDEASMAAIQDDLDDWQLLFQLDSDHLAGFEWADGGSLFFAIRRQDLAARRFDRCWLTLQS